MSFNYILFDLDGTLTDSAPGITNCVKYALKSLDIDENDMEKLLKFVGPPLSEGFKQYADFSEEKIDFVVKKYRERFKNKGIFENALYDGIPETLEKLKNSGKELIVATSKPYEFTEIILKHFNIRKYFSTVCGSTFDGTISHKSDVIRHALNEAGITDKSQAIMIGDRHYDINGAKENGLKSIGVLYGYGSREELSEAGADYIAENLDELLKILL